jgi:hypothetical protein
MLQNEIRLCYVFSFCTVYIPSASDFFWEGISDVQYLCLGSAYAKSLFQ